ncbi:MAG: isochorismatase family protein [Bacteroidales bacterium]|nr:isochorismatase family protein [Bacteroidales bacterium]MCM1148352.1 isochorismatase family protein [Bacteroidales bacterium]MCM1207025.1 isochorismatase family protein [Bacillota bacterium]MCM1511295.1 isochorismatase family protein [Clostridium sp.]
MKKFFFLMVSMILSASGVMAQKTCKGDAKCVKGNRMLLLVDVQYDFINGSLAVNGAPESMQALADYIAAQPKGTYKQIVMTSDFHPYNHSSFKDNGGLWPVHCVQYSHGAAIFQPVLDAVHAHQADAVVLTKGDDVKVDEYSIMANKESAERLEQIIKDNNICVIEVAGLCGDYCVGNTIKDLVKAGYGKNICVLKKYIGNIDDGTVLNGIISDNKLCVKQ